jgi:hypothetical protein
MDPSHTMLVPVSYPLKGHERTLTQHSSSTIKQQSIGPAPAMGVQACLSAHKPTLMIPDDP